LLAVLLQVFLACQFRFEAVENAGARRHAASIGISQSTRDRGVEGSQPRFAFPESAARLRATLRSSSGSDGRRRGWSRSLRGRFPNPRSLPFDCSMLTGNNYYGALQINQMALSASVERVDHD
jgi:hypothetical protein